MKNICEFFDSLDLIHIINMVLKTGRDKKPKKGGSLFFGLNDGSIGDVINIKIILN